MPLCSALTSLIRQFIRRYFVMSISKYAMNSGNDDVKEEVENIRNMYPRDINEEHIITFGALADVQYADCENRLAAYDPSKVRFYRNALKHVDQAFAYWKTYPQKVSFVLQLGDVIDGLNYEFGKSESALDTTLSTFQKHALIPTYHTVGNHELYNFDRKHLTKLYCNSINTHITNALRNSKSDYSSTNPTLYYKFIPDSYVKCISLDCFDVSVLGYDKNHACYQEAAKVLSSWHGHSDFSSWDSNGLLSGPDARYQQMNGAIGKTQMTWLQRELAESDKLHQKVIVFGHLCLHPDSANWDCILWNYDEVMHLFHQHRCVVAYFSGHSHISGHAVDSHGIGYFVLGSVLETPPNCSSFATVSLYRDRIIFSGNGNEQSYDVPLMIHR